MGMFAGALPQATYGLDPGMLVPQQQVPQAAPLTQAALQPVSQPPVPPQAKPSFFGQGGAGRSIVGNFADGVLESMGDTPVYSKIMQRQQDARDRQQQQLASLVAQQQLWMAQQKYKADNPAPTQYSQDLTAAGIDPTSPQGRALYQERVTNQADPIQAIPSFDPTTGQPILRYMRPSQMGQQAGAAQRPAIGTVIDQLPGGGDPASTGGAGLTAPRPFP